MSTEKKPTELKKLKKQLETAKEVREEAIKGEFRLQKELEKRDQHIQKLEEHNAYLTKQLNELSTIFDKQFQQFSDLILMQQVFLRNTQVNKELIDSLVKKFNETEKSK
jgi:tRNA-dihydrouridine synthase